jgi:hypothetical protein
MDPATLSLLVSAVAGPASGVVVAMLCLVGFGYFMVKHMLPQQQNIIDDFVKESESFAERFLLMPLRLWVGDLTRLKMVLILSRMV